jgi:uncharacterized glyoxalase superfamily metalloenzyme YdcJ
LVAFASSSLPSSNGSHGGQKAEQRIQVKTEEPGGESTSADAPRTLDIDAIQAQMPVRNITPKLVVEGPPRRRADILLRQTSFKALEESVNFQGEDGSHTARFGEIEQRGVALTPAGRALYDITLTSAREAAAIDGPDSYTTLLDAAFSAMPDDMETLRQKALAFFQYRAADTGFEGAAENLSELIASGALIADPQVYEDFLPVSAAGIFQSNLGADDQSNYGASANQSAFEAALGTSVIDEMALYQRIEADSLAIALNQLGQSHLLDSQKAA